MLNLLYLYLHLILSCDLHIYSFVLLGGNEHEKVNILENILNGAINFRYIMRSYPSLVIQGSIKTLILYYYNNDKIYSK